LNRFDVTSSIGTIADPVHHDKELEWEGWVVFSRENGLLHADHPIVNGRDESETINSVVSFGDSASKGDEYVNLFRLSDTAENRRHPTGVGPDGMNPAQTDAQSPKFPRSAERILLIIRALACMSLSPESHRSKISVRTMLFMIRMYPYRYHCIFSKTVFSLSDYVRANDQ
jgi:hypothetical protein